MSLIIRRRRPVRPVPLAALIVAAAILLPLVLISGVAGPAAMAFAALALVATGIILALNSDNRAPSSGSSPEPGSAPAPVAIAVKRPVEVKVAPKPIKVVEVTKPAAVHIEKNPTPVLFKGPTIVKGATVHGGPNPPKGATIHKTTHENKGTRISAGHTRTGKSVAHPKATVTPNSHGGTTNRHGPRPF